MDLIIVSAADAIEDEPLVINDLFMAGLGLLHLRKPDLNETAFRKLIDGIYPCFYSRIALHQHHHLAREYGISKLHFPEHSRQWLTVEKLKTEGEAGCRFSTSIHDLSDIENIDSAQQEKMPCMSTDSVKADSLLYERLDYAFYGPLFNSVSKPGYGSEPHAAFILPPHRTKIIAIGGITPGKFERVAQLGFDGAAILGYVWHNSLSPLEAWLTCKSISYGPGHSTH